MFEHLKKLEVKHGATIWVDLPEVAPKARVQIKAAGETNPPYFNAMLKVAGARARRIARTDRISAEDAAQNRAEDRQLFPRYVLVGWEGILDTDNKPVPFSQDHARSFCDALPDWLFDRVRNAAATPERFVPEGEDAPDGATLGKP
jgi:hypothetical protein